MLPEEIIIDILSRLPAKSIGRFRCVSKPWRSLLSDPQFIKTHLNRIKKLPIEEELLILISELSDALYYAPLRYAHHLLDEMPAFATKLKFADHPDSWTEVMCSCDGLILIEGEEEKKFLVNPITKDVKELPSSPFALDAHASFTMYGFGYDSVSDDYKVVTLSYYDTDNEHEPECTEMFVNVYSVRNDTWKRADSSPFDHAVGHVTSGVYLDGCIHWLASRTSDNSSVIVAFDLAEEKYREVPPPSSVDSDMFVFYHLVVLGGCLCMYPSIGNGGIDVWMMKEYGVKGSWTKFTIIDPESSEFRPLCLLGREQVVMMKDEEMADEKLVVYNLQEGTFKDVVIQGIPDEFHARGTLMELESLVSPYYSNEARREC